MHQNWQYFERNATERTSKSYLTCIKLTPRKLYFFILSWNDLKKYKKYKIAYLFHCSFHLEKRWLNQNRMIRFYVFLIGFEHEPVVVRTHRSNWICRSQNARLKTFYSKAFLLPYSWKKHVNVYWNYTSFCVSCQFSRVFVFVFYIF